MKNFTVSFKKILNYTIILLLYFLSLSLPSVCRAMPPGTLLYRTSSDGKMFGYSDDHLLGIEKGIVKDVNSGHAAIYIGKENGVDYIVEALGGGIVKNPAKYFVNSSLGEKFLGAKIPRGLNTIQQAKVVALAKSLAGKNLAYDFNFKKQKGPRSGEWTCVGLTEKLYESADISNPNNLGALEYDPQYYAIDITPDGYDNNSVVNNYGDCFSKDYEFSKIARRQDMILPAPELIGYDAGLEHDGNRYIFLPYTQFIQPSLDNVIVDISISENFNDEIIRGKNSSTKIALRWSLINNPISSVKAIAAKVKAVVLNLSAKIFGGSETTIALNNDTGVTTSTSSINLNSPETKTTSKKTTVKKSTVKKATTTKKAVVKTNTVKAVTVKKAATAKTPVSSKNSQSLSTVKSTSPVVSKTKVAKTTTIKAPTIKATTDQKVTTAKNTVAKKITAKATPVKVATPKVTVAPKNNSTVFSGSNTNINTNTNSSVLVNIASNQNYATTTEENNDNTLSTTTETTINGTSTDATTSDDNLIDSDISTSSATSTDSEQTTNEPVDWPKLALIKRIYSTGDNDWVELFNPTDHDFDLKTSSYRLEKTKSAVTPSLLMRVGDLADGAYPGGTVIKAHDSYLIVRDDANDYYKNKADAIATRDEFTWSGNGYTLYLGNGAISSSTDENIVDAVGYGNDATYFLGSGPAPEIKDNYILTRVASTSDNSKDFSLILSDEPGLITTSSTLIVASSTSVLDWTAYIAPTPINSDGLTDLWHFDECYGNDYKWGVGKWGCALEINPTDTLVATLTPAYDLDNFSLSFNYKQDTYPRLNVELSNSYDEKINLQLTTAITQIDGLPETKWRYYQDYISNDNLWHQATLVVSRAEHYWSLYIDGQPKLGETFSAALPEMDKLKIYTDQSRTFIDELAFWHRVLSPEEILINYNMNAPFSPVENREAQTAPVLKNFWHFDEGHGSTTLDNVGGLSLDVPAGTWTASGRLNTAIISTYGKNILVDLKNSIKGKDYSLSMWWRNNECPNDGRSIISLVKDNKKMFGLTTSFYRSSYWFNNGYGIFHEGIGDFVPYDKLWHNLALTYDSYRYLLNFYVDGEEKASTSLVYIKDGDEPDHLIINSDSGNTDIDELGLWEGALSAKQIKTLFDNTPQFQ